MTETNERTYKVVVTGFGPFKSISINESWLAVQELWEMEWPSQIKLVTRELPVIYDVVKNEVNKIWEEEKPDLMIHVGVSIDSHCICIERQSFNRYYYNEDVVDKCPLNETCVEKGNDILATSLNVDDMCKATNSVFQCDNLNATCEPSMDPGRYLCGYSYYLSLSHDTKKSLFVHVPGKECCSIKEDSIALRTIIFTALKQLYEFTI